MLRQLAVLVARIIPAHLKKFVHNHRLLDCAVRRAFARLTGGSGAVIVIPSGCMKGISLSNSEHISHVHISGTYEIRTQRAIERVVKPSYICYDLGASIGYLSLLMARQARHVYAFEPAPHAAAEIRRNMEVNGFRNYSVVHSPVSSRSRTVHFALTDVAYGSGIVGSSSRWRTIELNAITLDEFAEAHEYPDFIKIDVEGEEAEVLRGARNILSRARPRLCCELHAHEVAREVLDILREFRYRALTLEGREFMLPNTVVAGELQIMAVPA